jgi:hypothetical protein
MEETPQTEQTKNQPRRLIDNMKKRDYINPREALIVVAFVVIVVILVHVLISNLQLKTDVNHAKTVSNMVVADIQDRNGAAVWALGAPSFKRTYSPSSLTNGFRTIKIATLKPPTLDQEFESSGSAGRTVFFIYKYSALKAPYFIRIAVEGQSGKTTSWKLTQITGNADETQLEQN